MNPFLFPNREILDRLHDAVIVTDLAGVVTNMNSAAERIYGYSRRELIGTSVASLYPESELPQMEKLIQDVMNNGRADGEFLNRTKTGKEICTHVSVSLTTDANQQPDGMIGFSIDITDHKKADLARREVEESDRAARAAAGVGTWYWDLKKDQLRWDEVSCRLLGSPPGEEQTFQNFLMHVHPFDRTRMKQIIRRCIENGEEYDAEYRVVHGAGAVHWIAARGKVICGADGTLVRMLGTGTDVTKQKLAEERLRLAEAKYRVLFESPIIGVASATVDRLTDVNEAFCEMVGYSREELLSGSVRWRDITPPEYTVRDFACLQDLAQAGFCAPFEKEYIRKDGRRVRVMIGASVVSREPFEWSCFVLDITDQQRALSGLRMSEQLAAAARMGSTLAHEINNPLASLVNLVYLLRYGPSSMPREELLISIQEALDRVSRITRQMIGIYSDAEAISEVKLSDVLEDTLAGLQGPVRTKNLRLEMRNEFGEGHFHGNESDIRRLVSALMENAVEHAPPGGTVKVHLHKSRDWNHEDREGVKIVVLDDGPGIKRNNLPQVCEPFVSTKKSKASGLGLWVTRTIADKYAGSLKIRSSTRSGKSGTCVTVFLQQAAGKSNSLAA